MILFENGKRRVMTAGILLLIAAGIGAYWYLRPDPQFVKVMELREKLTSEEARNLSRDQRRELFAEFRQEVAKLTPQQRRQLWAARANRFQERLEKFAKASPKERTTMLDEQIQREEQFRRNSQGFIGGNRGGGSSSPEDREQRRRQWLDNTTPEQRALLADFRQQLQQRRQQLGLPSSPWGGRGRGQRSEG